MTYGAGVVGSSKLEAGFARVKERFVQGLEDREDEFLSLLESMADPAQLDDALAEIRARAHKLHGLAGTVGFGRLGSLAAQLEHHIDLLIVGPKPFDTGFVKELLNALLDEIETILYDA